MISFSLNALIHKITGGRVSNFPIRELEGYISTNKFRLSVNSVSDLSLHNVNVYLSSRYSNRNPVAFKDPLSGVNDNFGFIISGNEDYHNITGNKAIPAGIIYTSEQAEIIPSPREETKRVDRLFRTSHGGTIYGDETIAGIVTSTVANNYGYVMSALRLDITEFLKRV